MIRGLHHYLTARGADARLADVDYLTSHRDDWLLPLASAGRRCLGWIR